MQSKPASGYVVDSLLGAEILDIECYRYVAHLARTPQSLDFLELKYQQYCHCHPSAGRYSFEQVIIEMAQRGLLVFQDEKWKVTPKAVIYINKYHGGL
jgi:hypothetical protein